MAVDAHNLFLSSPLQLFSTRELMQSNNNNTNMEPTGNGFCNTNQTSYGVVSPFSVTDGNIKPTGDGLCNNNQTGYGVVSPYSVTDGNIKPTSGGLCHNNQTGYGVVSPYSVTDDTTTPHLLHTYGGGADTIPTTVDSDLFPLPTRKRSRDSSRSNYYHDLLLQNHRSSPTCLHAETTTTNTTPFPFLGQDIDISSHINQHQHELNRFFSHRMERVKYEIEEKRKKQARTIIEAVEQGLAKKLRVKEEEKERISKINHALEERVKSLSVENQIWRDLAQSNEATANHLRANLEQVLAQVKEAQIKETTGAGLGTNVNEESCCGSSSGEEAVRRTVVSGAQDKMCRNCGEEESCVLLLPCRHLCLCGVCGSSVHTCPICRSPKNISVHVNMSSS